MYATTKLFFIFYTEQLLSGIASFINNFFSMKHEYGIHLIVSCSCFSCCFDNEQNSQTVPLIVHPSPAEPSLQFCKCVRFLPDQLSTEWSVLSLSLMFTFPGLSKASLT